MAKCERTQCQTINQRSEWEPRETYRICGLPGPFQIHDPNLQVIEYMGTLLMLIVNRFILRFDLMFDLSVYQTKQELISEQKEKFDLQFDK